MGTTQILSLLSPSLPPLWFSSFYTSASTPAVCRRSSKLSPALRMPPRGIPPPASTPRNDSYDNYSPRPLTAQVSSSSSRGGAINTSGNSYSNGLSALGEDSMMGMTDSALFQPHESTKL